MLLIAEIPESAVAEITRIINHGKQAVVRRSGTGVVVMEETRTIKYSDTPPKLDGRQRAIGASK